MREYCRACGTPDRLHSLDCALRPSNLTDERASAEAELQLLASQWIAKTGADAAIFLLLAPRWSPGATSGGIAGSARCTPEIATHYFYDVAAQMLRKGSFRCSFADCPVCRARAGAGAN